MSRAALPLAPHGAASPPDTEPVLRVAAAIEHELRGRRLIAPTLAPTRPPHGIETVRAQFARGDFADAFESAAALLARDPSHEEARSYATSCELRLRRRYAARLGSLRRVPQRAAAAARAPAEVDVHERAILELVDGRATTEEIVRGSGLAEMEALRLFVLLLDHGLVTLA